VNYNEELPECKINEQFERAKLIGDGPFLIFYLKLGNLTKSNTLCKNAFKQEATLLEVYRECNIHPKYYKELLREEKIKKYNEKRNTLS
jgi:hypothetical protein